MCTKWFKNFSDWFDIKFGWFFTNGNKMDARNVRIKKMVDEKRKQVNG